MEIQGKIIAALPERSGTSARGEWKAQDFVIETHEAYPKKMVFSVFGADRLARFNIQIGQEVTVSFDIDANEYNGRWFNSIRAYDVRQIDVNSMMGAAQTPIGNQFEEPFGAAPTNQAPFASATPQSVAQPTVTSTEATFSPQQENITAEQSEDDLPF